MSQFCCRRAFSHSSCEEVRASFNPRLCKCSKRPGKPVLPLLTLKTPGHPSYQPGLHLLRSVNPRSSIVTIHSTTIPVIWVSSRLEHRASTTTNRFAFSALQTKVSNSPQPFKLLLTTGATDLWVTGRGCANCTRGTPGFDNTTSSTFQAGLDPTRPPTRVSIPYSYGPVAGNVIQDTVTMGGFRVRNQTWLLVDQVPTQLLDGSCSGSMGLAFDNIGWTGATPFWQTLVDGGQLTTPEMSFWFTRLIDNQNAQEEEFGGVFTLGGRNQTLYAGDVEFLPLVTNAGRRTYWLLDLSGAYLICPRSLSGSFSRTYPVHRDHGQ